MAAACSYSPPSPTIAAFPYDCTDAPSADTARRPSRSPSSSPVFTSRDRSSSKRPANGFSMTAIAAAVRSGRDNPRPPSSSISSTTVSIFRIFMADPHVVTLSSLKPGKSPRSVSPGSGGDPLDDLRRPGGGRGIPAAADLHLPVDRDHRDAAEVAGRERLERCPSDGADGRIGDDDVGLAARGDLADGQPV